MKFDIREQEKLVGAALQAQRATRFAPSARYLPKSVQLDDVLCVILLVTLMCWLM